MRRLVPLSVLATTVIAIAASPPAQAGNVTACTALDLCYCVNTDFSETITANVTRVRGLIAKEKV